MKYDRTIRTSYSEMKNAHGRNIQSYELLPMLGLISGQHLPADGMAERFIAELQTSVRIIPRTESGRQHRVQGLCCRCNKWIPAGRFHQHYRRADHRTV